MGDGGNGKLPREISSYLGRNDDVVLAEPAMCQHRAK